MEKGGVAWARKYDAVSTGLERRGKIGRLPVDEACPLFPALETLCRTETALALVQVGCSSGRELSYFSERYPNVLAIGLDIVPEVVAYAASKYQSKNLRFEVCPAQDMGVWFKQYTGPPVAVFTRGALEYIPPSHIARWFQEMIEVEAVHQLLLQEAGDLFHGQPDKLRGSACASSWAYTHDYKHYAEAVGWKTVSCQIIRPYDPPIAYPEHATTVHYWYWARKSDAAYH